MQSIRLISGFLTVGFWTLVSRVLGFSRDILIAAFLGSGPVAEAFLVGFSLPNMFRRLFAEGAFNMAFVPMFSKKLEAGEKAEEFANEAFTGLATVLLFFSLLAILAMPLLVAAMASGFLGDERFDLAVRYGRIAFPYIFFISLAALLSGVLNATGRFTAAAAAPLLLNILFIGAMVLAQWKEWEIGDSLVWTVPIAGIAQLVLVWFAARRAGFALHFTWPRLSPDMKRLAIIAAPAALAGGVMQVNLLIGRQVASYFDGSMVWLSLADRLYQLPLGVVGIAVSVVLLPDLSRRLRSGDTAGSSAAFNRAAEFSLALTIPAAVALMLISVPLVSVLYERGAFSPEDTAATALAVAIYGLGLPAFVMQKVLQPLFFAREDTRRPFYFAVVAMIVNAVVSIGFAPIFGYLAAAIGVSFAGWLMMILLWIGSRGMGDSARLDSRLLRRLPRIAAASAVMGLALWIGSLLLAPILAGPGRVAALAILVLGGISVYGVAAHFLGAFKLEECRKALRG